MKMTPARIEQLRRRHLGAVGAQTDAISDCISALPDALGDLEELQRQLASSESIRHAGGKVLIEEIEGRALINAQLEEALANLRDYKLAAEVEAGRVDELAIERDRLREQLAASEQHNQILNKWRDVVCDEVGRAVAAERERCAKIANDTRLWEWEYGNGFSPATSHYTAQQIATRILKGGEGGAK